MGDCAIADQYTWVAIDRESRRAISHVFGKRNANDARVVPGQRIVTFRACSRPSLRYTQGNSDEYIACGGLHAPHPISTYVPSPWLPSCFRAFLSIPDFLPYLDQPPFGVLFP